MATSIFVDLSLTLGQPGPSTNDGFLKDTQTVGFKVERYIIYL